VFDAATGRYVAVFITCCSVHSKAERREETFDLAQDRSDSEPLGCAQGANPDVLVSRGLTQTGLLEN
jgi:hypothetical protein